MRNRQGITIAALIVAIIGLSIGFAAFSNTLTIRSSATVNPDSSALRVVFSLDDDSEVPGNTGGVTPDNSTYGDAGTINNATQGNSKIEGLHAKFTQPGQSVKYNVTSANLYVYNAGSLQAQLTGVTFNNAQGVNTYKKCTAVTTNKQASEIATDTLVQSACNDITISVKVGNKVATPADTSLNYQILGVGASLPAEITITYGGNVYVDGDFEVSFGDVVINATSAVNPALVVTPQETAEETNPWITRGLTSTNVVYGQTYYDVEGVNGWIPSFAINDDGGANLGGNLSNEIMNSMIPSSFPVIENNYFIMYDPRAGYLALVFNEYGTATFYGYMSSEETPTLQEIITYASTEGEGRAVISYSVDDNNS